MPWIVASRHGGSGSHFRALLGKDDTPEAWRQFASTVQVRHHSARAIASDPWNGYDLASHGVPVLLTQKPSQSGDLGRHNGNHWELKPISNYPGMQIYIIAYNQLTKSPAPSSMPGSVFGSWWLTRSSI